jgi:hypothetical protein
MAICKTCGNQFKVPKFAIDMVYASYCKPCIKIGLKAYAQLPIEEVIKIEFESMGLLNKTDRKEVRGQS